MQPTWQRSPCPPWCTSDHHEHDHADDRLHRSAGIVVPVVSRRLSQLDPVRHDAAGREYELGLSQRDDGGETWVYLGAGPQECLELSLDSWRRILDAWHGAHLLG